MCPRTTDRKLSGRSVCPRTADRNYQDVQCVLGLSTGIIRMSSVSYDYRQGFSGRSVCSRTIPTGDFQDVQCVLGLYRQEIVRTSSVS